VFFLSENSLRMGTLLEGGRMIECCLLVLHQ
jgi:hypothetical protein